jgi:peptidyl-prolyl cis-trans isomerase B (cyclophilin B)
MEIELFREDAPVTVDNFVSMARVGVYDGMKFERVFSQRIEIEQPIPGGTLRRNEINMRPFERGSVGMALKGANSHAGRFFITLAPQPYLDGVNTCFGYVVSGIQVAEKIAPGDRIVRVDIKEILRVFDNIKFVD